MTSPTGVDGSGQRAPAGEALPMQQPIYVLTLVNAVLRNRFRIVAIIMVFAIAAIVTVIRRPPQFVSAAAFSLQGTGSQRLSGLAAQFGLAVPSGDGQLSPAYYEELLKSREILEQAARATYTDSVGGKAVTVTLPQVWKVLQSDSALATDAVVQRLRSAVVIGRSRETAIVRVTASAPSPVLAQAILTKLIALVGEFNLKTRQSQAANERRFAETRLAETRVELRTAKDRLQEFLQRNRGGFGNVPELSLAHDRLMRDVTLRQQILGSLAQSYEQARLDEVRDTPAITMIESPSRPVRRAPRGLARTTALAIVFGALVGFMPLAIRILLSSEQRLASEEHAEFRRLRDSVLFWRRPARVQNDG